MLNLNPAYISAYIYILLPVNNEHWLQLTLRLQGKILECDLFILPLPELNRQDKLWYFELNATARMWYFVVWDELEKLGFKKLSVIAVYSCIIMINLLVNFSPRFLVDWIQGCF